jgi:type I restriction enzyme R subunit
MNILNSFDQFENDKLLTDRQMQDFQSRYLDLYKKYRRKTDKADIEDDVIFEIELVKQIEVNIDYILNLVQKYHNDNCLDDEATANILKAVDSSVQLRSKKELIAAFLARVNLMPSDEDKKVTDEWQSFVKEKYDDEVSQLIADEKLKEDKTRSLLDKSFNQGELKTGGTAIDDCMPPMSRFGGGRAKKKLRIIDKFKTLFEKFSGIM